VSSDDGFDALRSSHRGDSTHYQSRMRNVSDTDMRHAEEPEVIVSLPEMVPTAGELPPEGCPVMAGTGEETAESSTTGTTSTSTIF